MWYGDLTHDGLSELTIVTTGGVHILQVSLSFSTSELKYFCKMGKFSCFYLFFYYIRKRNRMLNDTKRTNKQNHNKEKETQKKKLSDNTVNRRRPGRKTTQPEGCIPMPEGDGAALEEVSGCISRRDTEALA